MSKTYIIAEAGVNHNGDLKIALELINAASKAGADIIKFQTFDTDNLVTHYSKKADYQIRNDKDCSHESQRDMLKKFRVDLFKDKFDDIKLLEKKNLVIIDKNQIKLTNTGKKLSDSITEKIIY